MIQTDSTQVDSLIQQRGNPPADLGAIYEPPAVSFSFDTIGWTVLGGALMLGLLILLFFLIRRYQHNQYRREAMAALQSIASNEQEFSQVFILLKRVAIRTFGREKVGALYGASWLGFLDKTGKGVGLLRYEKQIESLIYQDKVPDPEVRRNILSQAHKWIKTHAG
ncbi:DUF4381 domain-containing protein [Algoriphagus sp. NG3]|uniref:DUF4381 domain-containing protein n=1 Tax=Algoriphagus sp. NG3 TaxID=3097546 RepID=UPI002A7FCEEA|nr:DUF4381 domain-containing protein [Algoriphagus sp. NG3]WPR75249.1 DUF4381 domain-containing protein [Algoriphagus sp. NG3]